MAARYPWAIMETIEEADAKGYISRPSGPIGTTLKQHSASRSKPTGPMDQSRQTYYVMKKKLERPL
jgi:hypothetical protein